MRVLDRSFFKTTVPLASAAVMEARNIGPVQTRLMKSKDLLNVPFLARVKPVAPVQVVRKEDEDVDRRRKCLLLRPEIKPDGTDMSLYCVLIRHSRSRRYTFAMVLTDHYLLARCFDMAAYHNGVGGGEAGGCSAISTKFDIRGLGILFVAVPKTS
jgi:hypothetical protein